MNSWKLQLENDKIEAHINKEISQTNWQSWTHVV